MVGKRANAGFEDLAGNPEERRIVAQAAESAETWDTLPDTIKALIRDIEARMFPLGLL